MALPALNQEENRFIQEAAAFLEHPGFAIRAMNMLGQPIDALQKRLPDSVRDKLGVIVQKSLQAALTAAIKTVQQPAGSLTGARPSPAVANPAGCIQPVSQLQEQLAVYLEPWLCLWNCRSRPP
jgi:hypothetical protein